MNQEIGYEGYFHFKDYTWHSNMDFSFNPASISKLFYASYLVDKYGEDFLRRKELFLTVSQYFRYKGGTVKLGIFDINKKYSINELLEFSLLNSCNIATGILADFAGRENVNEYIRARLNLGNTSVYSSTTQNVSSISDMLTFLRYLKNNKFLLSILEKPKRRAVLRAYVGTNIEVLSKGGTTYTGLRREIGLIISGHEIGEYVLVQTTSSLPRLNIIDKILAIAHLGKLHNWLVNLNTNFEEKMEEISKNIV
jgi:hypothetical protein